MSHAPSHLEATRSGSIRLFARGPGGGMAYAGDLKSIRSFPQDSAPTNRIAKTANVYTAIVIGCRATHRTVANQTEKPTDTTTDTRPGAERCLPSPLQLDDSSRLVEGGNRYIKPIAGLGVFLYPARVGQIPTAFVGTFGCVD